MARVLIVDDEQILTDAYNFVLKKGGYTVDVANHPSKGLELAAANTPDVILLDMLMPDMNGVEFMKELRKRKLAPNAKIVAFSNIENEEVMSAIKKLGASDYLLKVNYTPHQVAELVATVLKR